MASAQAIHAQVAAADSARRDSVLKVLQPVYYGVPTSPAFELLPDQPNEVTHITSAKDFQSKVQLWQDLRTVRAGVAFDARPFVAYSGDLAAYARSYWRRTAFRTVFSAGTATAVSGSSDVLVAAGLRIPLVDRGDPRANIAYLDQLARAYNAALSDLGPPPLDASFEELEVRAAQASKAIDKHREAYADSTWNGTKVDLGLAVSGSARGGQARRDSLQQESGGVWAAGSIGLGRAAQVTIAGKSVWARTDTATDESMRGVAGVRVITLAGPRFSASAEYASVWSRYREDASLNERWDHLGLLAEWYVPELGGWLGVSYGGDSARRGKPDDRFALHYALYRDRILK